MHSGWQFITVALSFHQLNFLFNTFMLCLQTNIVQILDKEATLTTSKKSTKALVAQVIKVSEYDISPVEFALTDISGAIKVIWYYGTRTS